MRIGEDIVDRVIVPFFILVLIGLLFYGFNVLSGPDWSEAEVISEDPRFKEIEPLNVSDMNIAKKDNDWARGDSDFGAWSLQGLGDKPTTDVLKGENESGFFLHPWAYNPESPGAFHNSNISQEVKIPEDARYVRGIIRGRSGYATLPRENDSLEWCRTVKMVLRVKTDEKELYGQELVEEDVENITIGLQEYRGENVTLAGGVGITNRCPRGFEWLEIRSLGIEAIR